MWIHIANCHQVPKMTKKNHRRSIGAVWRIFRPCQLSSTWCPRMCLSLLSRRPREKMLPRRLLVSKKYMSDDISSIQCIDSNLNWIKMLALCYWNMSFSMCFIECVCSYYVYLNRHLDVNTNSKNNKQSTHTHTHRTMLTPCHPNLECSAILSTTERYLRITVFTLFLYSCFHAKMTFY